MESWSRWGYVWVDRKISKLYHFFKKSFKCSCKVRELVGLKYAFEVEGGFLFFLIRGQPLSKSFPQTFTQRLPCVCHTFGPLGLANGHQLPAGTSSAVPITT